MILILPKEIGNSVVDSIFKGRFFLNLGVWILFHQKSTES